jgi:hypothetical protein
MPGAPANTGSNGAAIAALILGIIAILTGWFFLGVLFAIGGIVCGLIGIKKSKAAGKGKAMSIIGIVLSILAIASAIAVGFGIKKVVDSVDTANPNDYSVTTASCTVSGGFLNADGELTNRTAGQKNFMVSIEGGSFAATTVVELAAGETKPWTILADSTGRSTCGETKVRNFLSGFNTSE